MDVFLSIPSDYCVYYTTLSAHRHVFFEFSTISDNLPIIKKSIRSFLCFLHKDICPYRKEGCSFPLPVQFILRCVPQARFPVRFGAFLCQRKTGEPVPGLRLSKNYRFSDNLCSDCAEHESSESSHAETFSSRRIKTEVHAPGFDIFVPQILFHARCRAASSTSRKRTLSPDRNRGACPRF